MDDLFEVINGHQNKEIKAWIKGVPVEVDAIEQLKKLPL